MGRHVSNPYEELGKNPYEELGKITFIAFVRLLIAVTPC